MINTRVKNQKSRVRSQGGNSIAAGLILAACCLLSAVFYGTSHAKEAPRSETEITNIEISDHMVKIKFNGPVKYRFQKHDDPFRINLDLEDVGLGKFRDKIYSYRQGITEVTPTQIEKPYRAARLDMLLQAPSSVRPELKDDTLTVFVGPEGKDGGELIALAPAGGDMDKDSASEITDVLLEKTESGVELIIRGDGPMPDPSVSDLEGRLIIDIPEVGMGASLPSQMLPPVTDIRYREEDDKVRFMIKADRSAERSVFSFDDEVVVSFTSVAAKFAKADQSKKAENSAGAQPSEIKNQKGQVSLDFQDAEIIPILRLLSDVSGYNIVVHPDVKGKITMKLLNVPWEQAMDIILKTFNLEKVIEGNVIRVAPLAVFAKESDESVRARESEMKAVQLETRVFSINFADGALVEGNIRSSKVLSPRGTVSFDRRTSSLVVNDVPSVFPMIDNLLLTLDKSTPQVLIEARIVEINTSDTVDLGIQWGLNFRPTDNLSTLGGLSTVSSGPFTGRNFLVDLPGAGGSAGAGSGITFGILNPARTLGLDLQLSALEGVSKGRIISNPKIVTTDNEKAKIMQGTSEPFPQLSGTSGNVSASFKDVALTVEVTPHITPDGSVGMEISVVKEDILSTVLISGSQVPRTSKVESKTKVLVQNGETLVIGGVYKLTETDAHSGVPLLKDIPVLGWLFKNKTTVNRTSELMLFITPRIIERAQAGK